MQAKIRVLIVYRYRKQINNSLLVTLYFIIFVQIIKNDSSNNLTRLSNCFNNIFKNNVSIQLMSLARVSLGKDIQLFLFDSNAINKKMLDLFSKKHLHENEVITLHQRKKPQAQQEFIISRMLIKQLFLNGRHKLLHQIEIKFNEESLMLEVFYLDKRQPISISLSHSNGVIFLALSLSKVSLGVDIEYINTKRDVKLLANNFYHSMEVEQIEQRGVAAFYRVWTLKEAISKHLKQPIVTTLRQNIFELLPLLNYQNIFYNDFDLSFVADIAAPLSIDNSVKLLSSQDFLNVFTDASHTDLRTAHEKA